MSIFLYIFWPGFLYILVLALFALRRLISLWHESAVRAIDSRWLLMLLNYSRAYLHHFDHSLYIPSSHTPQLANYVQWLHVIGQTTVIFNHYLWPLWKQKKTKPEQTLARTCLWKITRMVTLPNLHLHTVQRTLRTLRHLSNKWPLPPWSSHLDNKN